MLFLNTALLLGALGIAIPIVIHLLNRRSSRVVKWGAMNFLLESLAIRNRRIQLEEALLMATRCILVGLLALALARPFIPPGSSVPWIVILPLLLLAVVGIGVATVLHNEPKWRRRIAAGSLFLLLACAALFLFEKHLNLSRFAPGARQDIALVLDGSTSMSIQLEGESNFERAVEEARAIVRRAPRGHAFSLVLGGPAPTGVVAEPTTDRAELLAALDDLAPVDGSMAAYESLMLASLSLARGDNPAKQVVVLSDGQNLGWEIGRSGRWTFLRDAFRNLPSEPQILLRQLPLPGQIRNLAVTGLELSRDIVGVDRPVEVNVTIENTGNEAVTPEALVLAIDDGRVYRDQSPGQIQPGERQTLRFTHQFSEPGAHALSATLEVNDEIESDDIGHFAVSVADGLKVLIVDGRPSARAFERASAFAAVALAPSALTLDPTLTPNRPGVADEASDDYDMFYDPTLDLIRFLVEPRVIEAPAIGTMTDFEVFDVVLLADVPRLPSASAQALVEFAENGGGLLVTTGSRAEASFYNEWKGREDRPFLPGLLHDTLTVAAPGESFLPSAPTLTHPALAKVADPGKSDFVSTVFSSYRRQHIPETLAADSAVGARLNNGDILLSSREAGRGRVILLSVPLDLSTGNLVTRQAFLPMLHELVYHLARPSAHPLNLEPGWEVNLPLSGRRGSPIGQGLTGQYFPTHTATTPAFTRTDEVIDFDWGTGIPASGVPADNFRVEWRGSIQMPHEGRYAFSAEVDDELELSIDGKRVAEFTTPGGRRQVNTKYDAGKWYSFEAVYREHSGEARAVLSWESDQVTRQRIPSKYFRAFAPESDDPLLRSQLTRYEVAGPRDRARTALLASSESGTSLKLRGEISSGLYRLNVPEEQRVLFSHFLRPDRLDLPFTVTRDPAESRLEELTETDYAFLANFVTLAQPSSADELIGFLHGNQFGEELWKYLALGAFFFLLLEIGLSRWIARSRRMGEEIAIQFESKDAPSSAFRDQLAKMRNA